MTRLAISAAACLAVLLLELLAHAASEARALRGCDAECVVMMMEPRHD